MCACMHVQKGECVVNPNGLLLDTGLYYWTDLEFDIHIRPQIILIFLVQMKQHDLNILFSTHLVGREHGVIRENKGCSCFV